MRNGLSLRLSRPRPPEWGSGGRRFESSRPDFASLAVTTSYSEAFSWKRRPAWRRAGNRAGNAVPVRSGRIMEQPAAVASAAGRKSTFWLTLCFRNRVRRFGNAYSHQALVSCIERRLVRRVQRQAGPAGQGPRQREGRPRGFLQADGQRVGQAARSPTRFASPPSATCSSTIRRSTTSRTPTAGIAATCRISATCTARCWCRT